MQPYTGWPKKLSHYQIIKKLCYIVLKSANEIRFLRQIKEMIKHYNPSVLNILCVTYFLTPINTPDLSAK